MNDKKNILNKIKETILAFDENAVILLYGSQTRGAALPDSDWDFIILTETELDYDQKREIRKAIHLIELENEEIISVIIHSQNYWNRTQNIITPFYKNVDRESITL